MTTPTAPNNGTLPRAGVFMNASDTDGTYVSQTMSPNTPSSTQPTHPPLQPTCPTTTTPLTGQAAATPKRTMTGTQSMAHSLWADGCGWSSSTEPSDVEDLVRYCINCRGRCKVLPDTAVEHGARCSEQDYHDPAADTSSSPHTPPEHKPAPPVPATHCLLCSYRLGSVYCGRSCYGWEENGPDRPVFAKYCARAICEMCIWTDRTAVNQMMRDRTDEDTLQHLTRLYPTQFMQTWAIQIECDSGHQWLPTTQAQAMYRMNHSTIYDSTIPGMPVDRCAVCNLRLGTPECGNTAYAWDTKKTRMINDHSIPIRKAACDSCIWHSCASALSTMHTSAHDPSKVTGNFALCYPKGQRLHLAYLDECSDMTCTVAACYLHGCESIQAYEGIVIPFNSPSTSPAPARSRSRSTPREPFPYDGDVESQPFPCGHCEYSAGGHVIPGTDCYEQTLTRCTGCGLRICERHTYEYERVPVRTTSVWLVCRKCLSCPFQYLGDPQTSRDP